MVTGLRLPNHLPTSYCYSLLPGTPYRASLLTAHLESPRPRRVAFFALLNMMLPAQPDRMLVCPERLLGRLVPPPHVLKRGSSAFKANKEARAAIPP